MNSSPPTLAERLETSQKRMIDMLDPLTDAQFFAPKNGKWSCAETLQHLFLSARTLPRLLTGPRAVFDQWPRSGRASRSYETIAATYNRVLATTGITAPASLVARSDDIQVGKSTMLDRFTSTHAALIESSAGWSADELATYQLPHPALGLITVGEMIAFTAHHIEHHRAIEAGLL